jgi:hypothetical protein
MRVCRINQYSNIWHKRKGIQMPSSLGPFCAKIRLAKRWRESARRSERGCMCSGGIGKDYSTRDG